MVLRTRILQCAWLHALLLAPLVASSMGRPSEHALDTYDQPKMELKTENSGNTGLPKSFENIPFVVSRAGSALVLRKFDVSKGAFVTLEETTAMSADDFVITNHGSQIILVGGDPNTNQLVVVQSENGRLRSSSYNILFRSGCAIATLYDTLYIAGGRINNSYSSEVNVIDLGSETIDVVESMQLPRADFALIPVGTRLIAIGGRTTGDKFAAFEEEYDIYNAKWKKFGENHKDRAEFAVAYRHGKAYIAGGRIPGEDGKDVYTNTVSAFNVNSALWEDDLPPMKHTWENLRLTPMDGYILALNVEEARNAAPTNVVAEKLIFERDISKPPHWEDVPAKSLASAKPFGTTSSSFSTTGSSFGTSSSSLGTSSSPATGTPSMNMNPQTGSTRPANRTQPPSGYSAGATKLGRGQSAYTVSYTDSNSPGITHFIQPPSDDVAGEVIPVLTSRMSPINLSEEIPFVVRKDRLLHVLLYEINSERCVDEPIELPVADSDYAFAQDGQRVVIVGGTDRKGKPASQIRYYCFQTRSFHSGITTSKLERNRCAALMYCGQLYVAGGMFFEGGRTGEVEVYNFDSGEYRLSKTTSPLNHPRSNCSLVELDGVLYAIGGYDGKKHVDVIERYNPSSNSWETPDGYRMVDGDGKSVARSNFGVAAYDGRIYVVNGQRGPGESCESMLSWKPGDAYWTVGKKAFEKRFNPILRYVKTAGGNGQLVVMGGLYRSLGSDDSAKTAAKYDPKNDSWEAIRHEIW